MKKILILFISIIFAVSLPLSALAEWVDADRNGQEGIKVNNQGERSFLAIDSLGRPHIVWSDSVTSTINYLWWDGSAWVDADGVGQESMTVYASADYPRLALDNNGRPGIAFGCGTNIYYLYYNGSSWVDADGSGQESINVYSRGFSLDTPALIFDSINRPHLAWTLDIGGVNNWDVYYLSWNGSAWVDVDGVGQESANVTNNTDSHWPELGLNSLGNPCLVFNRLRNTTAYLFWNGSAWVDVDGTGQESISIGYTASGYSFKIDGLNRPRIAFTIITADAEVYYMGWNGSAWADVSGSGISGIDVSQNSGDSFTNASSLVLQKDNDYPAIAWQDNTRTGTGYDIYYLFWNGSEWVDADGAGRDNIIVYQEDNYYQRYPSLALNPINGYPNISWSRDLNGQEYNIFFLEWWVPNPLPPALPQTGENLTGFVNRIFGIK